MNFITNIQKTATTASQKTIRRKRKKYTIEDMHAIAMERGGECLSLEYVNNKTKLWWRCGTCGYEWEATPNSVQRKTWCPQCGGTMKKTLEDMQAMAAKRGGKCLSTEYVNSTTKLLWECKNGHQWETVQSNVQQGRWCMECARKEAADKLRSSIEDMQIFAAKRGGECLSTKYVNAGTHLLWKCAEGHKWNASPGNILSGHWCPVCNKGVSERICRVVFEAIFKRKFPTKRPFWLRNLFTGKNLELDGYCKELKLAFEYQGQQHFKPVYGKNNLKTTQSNDQLKVDCCRDNGVTLVVIPPFSCKLNNQRALFSHIKKACKKAGLSLSEGLKATDIDLGKAYLKNRIEEMQALARERGGKCLSTEYVNAKIKLRWQCGTCGYEWGAAPGHVRRGSWCPACANSIKKSMKDMQVMAAEKGGKCLSTKYVNNSTKLLWKCENGHTWKATPAHIQQGGWCPKCRRKKVADGQRLTIKDMQALAAKHDDGKGKCLSVEYVNSKTKLRWACGTCGYEWNASPNDVQQGCWCPECGKKRRNDERRLTIKTMKALAALRGGECLSTTYVNNHGKLRWRCGVCNLEWETSAKNIKRGAWCPVCRKNKDMLSVEKKSPIVDLPIELPVIHKRNDFGSRESKTGFGQ